MGSGCIDPCFIDLSTRWRWVSDQLHAPAALPSGERAPSIHWIGGWMSSKAGLGDVEK
jgi:hypothetical protein